VKARLADRASATTINRSLEVVRTILNRAAGSYRDADGRTWLDGMPPQITMSPESPRSPYPITWKEQDALFRRLPTYVARMALLLREILERKQINVVRVMRVSERVAPPAPHRPHRAELPQWVPQADTPNRPRHA